MTPEATTASVGDDPFFGGADGGEVSFCAISFSTCAADLEIGFAAPAMNLVPGSGGPGAGDEVGLVAGKGLSLFGGARVASNITAGPGGFGATTRLLVADRPPAAGFRWGGAGFHAGDGGTAAPLPATARPLPGGLAAGTPSGRRRRA